MTDTSDIPERPVSGDVIGAPDKTGEWLPPAAAATRLGVSERTLWHHVNAGRYHKRTVSGRAEIMVPGEAGAVPDNRDSGSEIAVSDADRQMSLAVIEELRRRLDAESDRQRRLTVKTERQALEIGRLQAERDRAQDAAAAARAEADELRERLARRRWWKPSTW